MTGEELPRDFGQPKPMMVELLYIDAPEPDVEVVLNRTSELAQTRVERIGREDGATGFAFPDHLVQFGDAAAPLNVWLLPAGSRDSNGAWIDDALRQTWSWPEAEPVVRATNAALLVTDIMAGPLDPRIRLPLYHAVLGTMVESTKPAALRWVWGERFTAPEAYIADRAEDPLAFESTVNVRYVTIQDRPDEQLMDTAGMQPFALPDAQMHFTTLEPGWVAAKLHGIARYLFEHGDVIEDGQTVPGLQDGERWPCHHEIALNGPVREVLDVDPSPYGPARS